VVVAVAFDGEAGLGIEEMQPFRVDDQTQLLSLARRRPRMDASDEDRARIS